MELRSVPSLFDDAFYGRGLTSSHSANASASVVDRLICERAPNLTTHPLWPAMRPLFYRVLNYRRAVAMSHEIACLPGSQALDRVSNWLGLTIDIRGRQHIPADGGCIIIANHPTGIADGIALYDVVREIRDDIAIFANRDALSVNARFSDVIIPVEWRTEAKSPSKSRQTLELTSSAFRDGKVIILFPSGRIAYMKKSRLTEREWRTSAVTLARKYDVPVIPVHIGLRNSQLFYQFARWSTELRDMTVFHEFLNKTGQTVSIICGKPIAPTKLDGEIDELTARLRAFCVDGLRRDPEAEFRV